MFDTLTVVAYLMSHESGYVDRLRLHKITTNDQLCLQREHSPELKWFGVPPEASSLAVIIKDNQHYEWVVYNLPVNANGLPFGANQLVLSSDQGVNSWGQRNYHAPCYGNLSHPVTIKLYALDKRFSAREDMTGEMLEKKMVGHVLAKAELN